MPVHPADIAQSAQPARPGARTQGPFTAAAESGDQAGLRSGAWRWLGHQQAIDATAHLEAGDADEGGVVALISGGGEANPLVRRDGVAPRGAAPWVSHQIPQQRKAVDRGGRSGWAGGGADGMSGRPLPLGPIRWRRRSWCGPPPAQ